MKVYTVYTEGKKRKMAGRLDSEAYRNFVLLYEKRKLLLDIYPDDPVRIQQI